MKEKKQSDLAVLLGYAGSHKGLTFLGLGLSAVAMVLGMLPYICIWLVDLAGGPGPHRRGSRLDAGDRHRPLRLDGLCLLLCGDPGLFRRADVYAPRGLPHGEQHPQGRHAPYIKC